MNEKKIKAFIATRQKASQNTKLAYFYDLRAFLTFLNDAPLTQTQLNLYQAQLQMLAKSSQHRKITNINTFLKYLYQNGELAHFFELQSVNYQYQKNEVIVKPLAHSLELAAYYHAISRPGDLIALLILEFGLKPSEIQQLHWADFNWDYKILTVDNGGIKRILPIRDKFARLARPIKNGDELFSKSRQFLHYELKKSSQLTAKSLREQYILQRVSEKLPISELAGYLGLKSNQSLEKYYR
ncbi:tyrosine recombinase XerD-like protein [Lactococcus hodotermopsidis]|uniref:Tyrosine recombinase XerD-like protein n=1 Tax=Pseudolactococcus hodotermopsidis TaxID=2709157 RepID=A0A6A0BBW3_9LACT|nr:site-specific tyrosine recombinase XerD [Lactococcus hodotermopsidis]GFH41908.1 tyrosine recombinase XerD-like protein [Lactococcus hodotermopsidis]